MIDFLTSANWILVFGVIAAVVCLLYEFYDGGKVDLDDGLPNWLRAHYRSRRR